MKLQRWIVMGMASVVLPGCIATEPGSEGASDASEGQAADESEEAGSAAESGDEGEGHTSSTGGTSSSSTSGESSSVVSTSEGDTGTSTSTSSDAGTTSTTGDPVGSSEGSDDAADEETGPFTGTCTPSVRVMTNARGSGPHDVVVETNSDPGIEEGTIFRPADLDADAPYPIFVWGQGGCSRNGLSNAAAMAEIASYGYFVVADGTPDGDGSRSLNSSDVVSMGAPLIAYIDWAVAENDKPCSAYHGRLDPTKIASNGFSCGGLMAAGTAGDPRITTWGHTSSGLFSSDAGFYAMVHTPVLIVEGGPSDIAYENGLRDYQNISELDVPLMWFSKDLGHGGDLFSGNGGDFTKINLAWLNWWLKGDEGPTGKGLLVGAGCPYCSDPQWEAMSNNVP